MNNAIKELEIRIKAARERGGLFHPTNPADSWFCGTCSVFGRGGTACWSCDGEVEFQIVPRFGGGAQSYTEATE